VLKTLALALFPVALGSAACGETPVVRAGPVQQRIVARTYAGSPATVRAKVLEGFEHARPTLPEPYRQMTAHALTPPGFSPDWLVTFVDPGGFLKPYTRLPAGDKAQDVLIQDATGDLYWASEYQTTGAAKESVRFHCGLVVHPVPSGSASVEVQIYEVVPTIWVGEHWAIAAHGIGPVRVHDIRFVEPTVTDRVKTLEVLDRLLQE
jgi:hypothetical protein